jgi:tRNA (guanine37-N1)-methyltransferase
LTNLDIHDIARVSRSYCLGGFFLVTPLQDQQNLARKVISHWTEGGGADANPLRSDALKRVQVVDAWEDALQSVTSMCGQVPRVVCTSARNQGQLDFAQVRSWLDREPVLLLFGTGSGLAKEVLSRCDGTLRPVRILDDYNHLSVRSAASIIVDRILGDFA